MTVFLEFPKWLHADGKTSVLVQNADAEAAQIAAWAAEAIIAPAPVATSAAPASNLGDWDGDGRPGGSVASEKPENALTAPAEPKRGGWPKGKSRNGNRH